MKYIDEFHDGAAAGALSAKIAAAAGRIGRPVRLMEVCGTHTVAVHRHGLRDLFPPGLKLVSGPGCPVCVTPADYVDSAIKAASLPGVTVVTFGDMVRVPGSRSTLVDARASGADVRVVYSPTDALEAAAGEPAREVVFLGVGFETTVPSVAGTMVEARRRGVKNFSVLGAFKQIPNTMRALISDPALAIDGFLCPAHVAAIIGSAAYSFIPAEFKRPCVVAGFEPLDILYGVLGLVTQLAEGRAEVENQYSRVVKTGGNALARRVVHEVLEPADAVWRGIGTIPVSGFRIREGWRDQDAARRFDLSVPALVENPGCRCGEVLRGSLDPPGCSLFGKGCTPERPVGPCMVSSEGSCAANYKYSRQE
ncbi:MAG: hydrogenase formation protein HypD [Deltaproteobacteria bacterium]|nr:hydrogenase formation protein HypD [Deltaproteobacteria bacterium]